MTALEEKGQGSGTVLSRVRFRVCRGFFLKQPQLLHAHEEGVYFTGTFHIPSVDLEPPPTPMTADLAVVSPQKVLCPKCRFEG